MGPWITGNETGIYGQRRSVVKRISQTYQVFIGYQKRERR